MASDWKGLSFRAHVKKNLLAASMLSLINYRKVTIYSNPSTLENLLSILYGLAEPGSSTCRNRVACTESEYYQYNSPCNEKKQTQLMYKWIQPKICREDVSGAAQLPRSGIWQDCPPCNPGMTYSHNISGCVFCPRNTYSDGGSGNFIISSFFYVSVCKINDPLDGFRMQDLSSFNCS